MKNLRKTFSSIFIGIFLFFNGGISWAQSVSIAIISDGPSSTSQSNINALKQEISNLLEGEYLVNYLEGKNYLGNWNLKQVENVFKSTEQQTNVDIVIAYGPLASHVAIHTEQLNKPTIATLFLDDNLQSVPRDGDHSGKKNLTYIQHERSFLKDIKLYQEIRPFKKLAILGDRSLIEIDAFNDLLKIAKQRIFQDGVELIFIPMDRDIPAAIAQIEKQITAEDAVYLLPNERLTDEDVRTLGTAMVQRKIPAFAMQDSRVVQQGFLAVYSHEMTNRRVNRRIALNIRDILNGEAAENLNVYLEINNQLLINQETANKLDIGLTWSTLEKAEVVNINESSSTDLWTLDRIAQEAVSQNLSLLAQRKQIAASEQDVMLAKANRLPQLSLDIQQTWIDEDRARFSNGNSAERDLSASLVLQQVLYNEAAWSNIATQKLLQEAREHDLASIELDIIASASLDYLNLLRAQSLIEVEQNNVSLTKANLERAKRRVEAGAARKSEVFRWQSQLANNQRSLLDAESRYRNAQVQINQILNRPLDKALVTEKIDKDHPVFDFNRKITTEYITGPIALNRFTSRSEKFGKNKSPELKSIAQAIKAQQRLLTAHKRQYYVPDVSLQASLKEHIDKNGEGDNFPPTIDINDTDASVAVVVSLPLYSGGERSAEKKQTLRTIEQLKYQLADTTNQVAQRIRTAINGMSSSYPGIQLSEDALVAAQQNYEIVRKSYERGTVSIIDFLDAQNQAFSAEVTATNAIYDFLEDQISYQRSIGYFFDLSDDQAITTVFAE